MAIGATPHRGALNFSANKPKDMSSAARLYKQKQETHTHTQTHTYMYSEGHTDSRTRQTFIYVGGVGVIDKD